MWRNGLTRISHCSKHWSLTLSGAARRTIIFQRIPRYVQDPFFVIWLGPFADGFMELFEKLMADFVRIVPVVHHERRTTDDHAWNYDHTPRPAAQHGPARSQRTDKL